MTRKEIREKAGLSQAELAKKLGVGRATVQRFEYGQSENKKLTEFYAKQQRTNIRNEVGLTQQDIADFLGVNKSTVSRYEGNVIKSTKNKELELLYSAFTGDKVRDKRIREFITKSNEVNKRVADLTKIEASGDYGTSIPALEYYRYHKKGYKKIMDILKERKEFSTGKITQAIAQFDRFLELQTSTLTGIQLWRFNQEQQSMKTSGYYDEDRNKIFWDVYQKVVDHPELAAMNNPDIINYDSTQLQSEVKLIVENYYKDGLDAEEMFTKYYTGG